MSLGDNQSSGTHRIACVTVDFDLGSRQTFDFATCLRSLSVSEEDNTHNLGLDSWRELGDGAMDARSALAIRVKRLAMDIKIVGGTYEYPPAVTVRKLALFKSE